MYYTTNPNVVFSTFLSIKSCSFVTLSTHVLKKVRYILLTVLMSLKRQKCQQTAQFFI